MRFLISGVSEAIIFKESVLFQNMRRTYRAYLLSTRRAIRIVIRQACWWFFRENIGGA